MVPTFLQKRRGNGHALRLVFVMAGFILLFIGCVTAISMILVDRGTNTLTKVFFITGMLLGILLGTGLLARIRR